MRSGKDDGLIALVCDQTFFSPHHALMWGKRSLIFINQSMICRKGARRVGKVGRQAQYEAGAWKSLPHASAILTLSVSVLPVGEASRRGIGLPR